MKDSVSELEDKKEKLFRVLEQKHSVLIYEVCLCEETFPHFKIGKRAYWCVRSSAGLAFLNDLLLVRLF